MESARIPAYWKEARLSPLYKKGLVLDPGDYRMLAASVQIGQTNCKPCSIVSTGMPGGKG